MGTRFNTIASSGLRNNKMNGIQKIAIVVLMCVVGFIPSQAKAQVSINVNIGSQPLWGPVGYDYVDYYYLPDIEAYYYVPTRQFVYLNSGRWIFAANLPYRYRNYDLYNGYKVVIYGRNPYHHFHNHRVKYKGYRNNHSQHVIRNYPNYRNERGAHRPSYSHNSGRDNRGHQQNKNYNSRDQRQHKPSNHNNGRVQSRDSRQKVSSSNQNRGNNNNNRGGNNRSNERANRGNGR
jgi:hypothetical protein